MAERVPANWLADLDRNETVSRLIRAIALTDRFRFYLLLCDTPRVAGAVLGLLPGGVSEEREEPVRIVRLDPYEGRTDVGKPIAFERLVERVLERLVLPAQDERGGDVIVAVDASRALPEDDGAWSVLFQRMNERRNVIAEAHAGPLIACLPQRLEPTFAHAAPDFWSIRSLAVVVNVAPPALESMSMARDESARMLRSEDGNEERHDPTEIEAGIASARERLAKAPDDVMAMAALGVWLDRKVRSEQRRGALDQALHVAEELVELTRRLLDHEPEWTEMRRNLSASLYQVGVVQQARGQLEQALAAYDECVLVTRGLLEREPERTEWLYGLAGSLRQVGEVQQARGQLEPSLAAYDENVRITRQLLEREPERTEWLAALVAGLLCVGDAQEHRGDIEQALAAFHESLRIARRLVERQPEQAERLGEIAWILGRVGDVYTKRGEIEQALAAYDESVRAARSLSGRDPGSAAWQHILSVSLDRVGDIQHTRGDLARAVEAYDESLRVRRKLLSRDPESPQYHSNLALALVRQAWITEERGDLEQALRFWRDALAELESLVSLSSPLPIWLKQAEGARHEIARIEAALQPRTGVVKQPTKRSRKKR